MKKLLFAAALISSAVFIGCKSSGGGNPKEVLMEFYDAMAKKDMNAVRELTTPESKEMIGFLEMGLKSDKSGAGEDMAKYDKSKMEFAEPVIDGDNAKVTVKEKGGGTTTYSLKKISGKWKVAFDKSSVMQMGMEKANDGMMNVSDTAKQALDEIKNMDMDSMSKELNKAMDTAK